MIAGLERLRILERLLQDEGIPPRDRVSLALHNLGEWHARGEFRVLRVRVSETSFELSIDPSGGGPRAHLDVAVPTTAQWRATTGGKRHG